MPNALREVLPYKEYQVQVVLSGLAGIELLHEISSALNATRPSAIGIASAFVSVGGVESLLQIVQHLPVDECKLVAGIDLFITHPQALQIAREARWSVRLGKSESGIFHPKLIVAGARFNGRGRIVRPRVSNDLRANDHHAPERRSTGR